MRQLSGNGVKGWQKRSAKEKGDQEAVTCWISQSTPSLRP